jgi:hypothetical protein
MPHIKLDITQVFTVHEHPDRSVEIMAVDRVRGPITISMQETEARWLWASMSGIVPAWRQEDGED